MIVHRQIGGEFYASIHAYNVWHQELQNSSSIQQQPSVASYLFLPIDTKAQANTYLSVLIRSQTPHHAFAFPINNRSTFHLRKNVA